MPVNVLSIAICAGDLQKYINSTAGQNLSVKAVASMLAALGAESIHVREKKARDQSRWLLPVDEFDPADYVVDVEEGELVDA